MIDNTTGKATRVNLWPMRLDVAIRPGPRSAQLVGGWIVSQLAEAAIRLWPEFADIKEPPRRVEPLAVRAAEAAKDSGTGRFVAPWRRRMMRVEDDDGGI